MITEDTVAVFSRYSNLGKSYDYSLSFVKQTNDDPCLGENAVEVDVYNNGVHIFTLYEQDVKNLVEALSF